MVLKNQLRWKRWNAQITQIIYLKSTQECGTKDCGPKECGINVSEFTFKWAQLFTNFYYAFFQIFEYFPVFSYAFLKKITVCVNFVNSNQVSNYFWRMGYTELRWNLIAYILYSGQLWTLNSTTDNFLLSRWNDVQTFTRKPLCSGHQSIDIV